MSPPGQELPLNRLVSNSNGLASVGGLLEDNLSRNGHLRIRGQFTAEKGQQFWLYGAGDDLFPARESWEADVPLSPNDVFGHVEDCRKVWSQEIVIGFKETVPNPEGGVRPAFPFQERFDLKSRPELLKSAFPKLAVAGSNLFSLLFECDGGGDLKRVAQRLREGCQRGALTLLVTSDVFFIPWTMIYVHPEKGVELAPDGSNFKKEGFWGYQHIIEHNTVQVSLPTELKPDSAGKIHASINIDDTIDNDLGVPCIAPQLKFFQEHAGLDAVVRRKKLELETALRQANFADQIVYFCCHGSGADEGGAASLKQSRLALSDSKEITSADLKVWRSGRGLASNPLVFINACQGGQMTTLFYKTIAAEFLRQNAMALIGGQIDMPAVFAAEYARRLFATFLDGSSGNRIRLGPLMRDLAQEFVNDHNNPLGLAYSLYRGADCFVHR
jgi:hypothetical protein